MDTTVSVLDLENIFPEGIVSDFLGIKDILSLKETKKDTDFKACNKGDVLPAVQQSSFALQFASEELKKDQAFMTKALAARRVNQ